VGASDGDLVRAARAGRREAYEELVRRYSGRVTAICWAKLGKQHGAAEDLAQDAFLRAWRSLETLTEPERFGGWLYGIAVRACLDRLKDREWSQASFGALGPDKQPEEFLGSQLPPDSDLNQSEKNAKVLAEVQNLPEIYREVVTMFYFEQQTYEQMSAVLGIGGPAINARLMKARVLLRERLKSVTA